jgi:hypothetical protein
LEGNDGNNVSQYAIHVVYYEQLLSYWNFANEAWTRKSFQFFSSCIYDATAMPPEEMLPCW